VRREGGQPARREYRPAIRSYVAAAEERVGERLLAAGRFRRSRPATGGRKDWVSLTMRVLSVAMAGRDSDLPRRVVVAVSPERVYLLRSTPAGVGRPVAEWGRAQVRTSVDRSGRRCRMWVQPPGDRAGFELRPAGARAEAVVDSLAHR
jgi:hypothetical protein